MVTVIYRNFEWDSDKAKRNKIKHGISFKTATAVFDDPNRIEEFDTLHSCDEDRWQVTGMANNILFVVYTERFDRIRLISAREATEDERRKYYAYGVLHTQSWGTSDGGGES